MKAVEGIAPVRGGKPRSTGLTVAVDSLDKLDLEQLAFAADYLDIVKIEGALPLLADRARMAERIRLYHDFEVRVSTGGMLLEVAVNKQQHHKVLDRAQSLGFDIVEVSESVVDMQPEQKQSIVENAGKLGLECILEVGRKDPRRQLTLQQSLNKIDEAFKLGSKKVVLEGGGTGQTGIYLEDGQIRREWLDEVVGRFGPPNLLFEAPLVSQQVSLILEFGPDVNLGNIPLNGVLTLEARRLGLEWATMGVGRSKEELQASPAVKFVYHLIQSNQPMDQETLIDLSSLPKRTVQAALSVLVGERYVTELRDVNDARRKRYSVAY